LVNKSAGLLPILCKEQVEANIEIFEANCKWIYLLISHSIADSTPQESTLACQIGILAKRYVDILEFEAGFGFLGKDVKVTAKVKGCKQKRSLGNFNLQAVPVLDTLQGKVTCFYSHASSQGS
jgi:hypothetical protein